MAASGSQAGLQLVAVQLELGPELQALRPLVAVGEAGMADQAFCKAMVPDLVNAVDSGLEFEDKLLVELLYFLLQPLVHFRDVALLTHHK